jgi:hypothetical protein
MLAPFDLAEYEPEELISAVKKAGGQRAFARTHGIARSTLQNRLDQANKAQFKHRPVPKANKVKIGEGIHRFILTSAQDNTKVHQGFLQSLLTYRDYLSKEGPCEIMIGGITYNKGLFEDHGKWIALWDDAIKPFMRWERIRLGNMIDFCAEMNTRPTAKTPLTGFETYTQERWGVFPHAKVQLRSIANMKHEPTKQIMTTGSITLPNYVQLRAGIEAQFHHVIGAVLVEIDQDGTFFTRHLLADEDGSFYDLDKQITPQTVTEGHRVAAITWGDIHTAKIDPVLSAASFGIYPTDERRKDGRVWKSTGEPTMLDTLKPEYQFFHDIADFEARNHHNMKDPHHQFLLYTEGADSVETELREVAMLLHETQRPWCESVVVESNHDLALKRWLKEADYKGDPVNARFFLQCQLATYEAIEEHDYSFSIFAHVMERGFDAWPCADVKFLKTDESFRVFDIENGMHGHNGANGGRGSLITFAKCGPKSNTGHGHGAEIRDGAMRSGVKGKMDMGYNIGMSNWTPSDIVTLPNAKRQLVTWCNGRFRL